MRTRFQRETLDGFFPEALPLLQKHKDEISHFKDIPLDVDLDRYRKIEDAGALRIFTARLDRGPADELKLIGYAVFIVGANAHYKSSIQADQDVLYVDPEQRISRVAIELLKFTEDELRRDGVQVVHHHVKVAHPALGLLAQRRGYQHVENIWVKRLQ